jgi:hypothetical protein
MSSAMRTTIGRRFLILILFCQSVGCHTSSFVSQHVQLPERASAMPSDTPATPGQQVLLDQLHEMAEQDAMSRGSRGSFSGLD